MTIIVVAQGAGALHDRLIDANHMIHYLKYVATPRLLTMWGKEK